MLSDIRLKLGKNVFCSMAFAFHISYMKWPIVIGLEGGKNQRTLVSKFFQVNGK